MFSKPDINVILFSYRVWTERGWNHILSNVPRVIIIKQHIVITLFSGTSFYRKVLQLEPRKLAPYNVVMGCMLRPIYVNRLTSFLDKNSWADTSYKSLAQSCRRVTTICSRISSWRTTISIKIKLNDITKRFVCACYLSRTNYFHPLTLSERLQICHTY